MTEKEQIEQFSAEGFLEIYNAQYGVDFKIIEHGDSPDFKCLDSRGRRLHLEITMTQNNPGDIQALLGRSDQLSIEKLAEHVERVRLGKEKPQSNSSSANVQDQIVDRIQNKFLKDYGPNTALIVRDSSPIEWNWDLVMDALIKRLDLTKSPFDKGIWILNYTKTKLYPIVEVAA